MKSSAVVVCGGRSARFGEDKLALPLKGGTVAKGAVQVFLRHPLVDKVIAVVPKGEIERYQRLLGDTILVVEGGDTRTESVKAGLGAVDTPYVLVHDGARPLVSVELIDRVLTTLEKHPDCGVVPTVAMDEAVVGGDGYVDRATLRRVQTPQGFDTAKLRECLEKGDFADEGSAYAARYPVLYVEGDPQNRKLTHPVDYYGILGRITTGIGYDIHRLSAGRKLVLGGVTIPHDKGLLGHSDADCVLHAVMDACLSAVSLPDIGHYFAPNDPKWEGADSGKLLKIVLNEVAGAGGTLVGLSVAIVAEEPKLSPYVDSIKAKIACLCNLDVSLIGVTVTTNEKVPIDVKEDFLHRVGGVDAIAAIAQATVRVG